MISRSVTVGGTEVWLGQYYDKFRHGVEFSSDHDNDDGESIWIIAKGGSAASSGSAGKRLQKGESYRVPAKDLANYYAIASVADQVLLMHGE